MLRQGSLDRWRRSAILALATISAALAALLWQMAIAQVDISPLRAPGAAGPRAGLPEPPRLAAMTHNAGEHGGITSRPLFSPARRPPPPVQAGAVAPPANAATRPPELPAALRLMGVLKDSRRGTLALLATQRQPGGEWFKAGDELGGWRVVEINAHDVVMQAGNERRTIRLFRDQMRRGEAER